VLWEQDLFAFLSEHQHLVTDEQHAAAWSAAHVNNGYLKPA
jgi:phage antirepressor YoqD-like protein